MLVGADMVLGVPEGYWRRVAEAGGKTPESFVEWLADADPEGGFFGEAAEAGSWCPARPWFRVPPGRGGLTAFTPRLKAACCAGSTARPAANRCSRCRGSPVRWRAERGSSGGNSGRCCRGDGSLPSGRSRATPNRPPGATQSCCARRTPASPTPSRWRRLCRRGPCRGRRRGRRGALSGATASRGPAGWANTTCVCATWTVPGVARTTSCHVRCRRRSALCAGGRAACAAGLDGRSRRRLDSVGRSVGAGRRSTSAEKDQGGGGRGAVLPRPNPQVHKGLPRLPRRMGQTHR